MNKLRALFAFVAVSAIGGTLYGVAVLRPEYTNADAVDAGVLTVSIPAQLRCRIQINPDCKRADGGSFPRYAVAKLRARVTAPIQPDNLPFILIGDYPNSPDGGFCFRPVGSLSDSCEFIEDAGCTDPTVCAANTDPVGEANQCACRASAGQCLKGDGGVAPFGATLRQSIEGWSGAGCRAFYCGPEMMGEQGTSWPAACPQ